jgi:hypothetical protein
MKYAIAGFSAFAAAMTTVGTALAAATPVDNAIQAGLGQGNDLIVNNFPAAVTLAVVGTGLGLVWRLIRKGGKV